MDSDSVLSLVWAHGLSPVQQGVINLSDDEHERFFFVSSNTAVIQDEHEKTQSVMQGHVQPITCACCSSNRKVLATADTGEDSMIVLWDTETCTPQLKISQPHKHGVATMDMCSQAGLMATLSKTADEEAQQELSLWDLSSGDNCKNLITVPIPAGDVQTCVKFNPGNPNELISNGKRRVFFWQSCLPEAAAFKYYSPPLSSPDFKQKIGLFTTSVFMPGTTQAITGTQDGDAVIWDQQGISVEVGTRPTDRKAVKLMRLHNACLSFITSIGDFIVTGADDGHVRFFDPMLRLIAWFEHLGAGAVRSVSFSRARPWLPDPTDFDAFVCPDFLVGTAAGAIVRLSADAFNTIDDSRRGGTTVMRGLVGEIACCAAHPVRPQLLLVGRSGKLQLWSTTRNELAAERTLACSGAGATCAAYSRTGAALVVGLSSGAILVLDSATLAEVVQFRQSKSAIVAVSVSSSAAHIAAVTADGHTMLFFLVSYKQTKRWEYVGRARVHYSPAVAVHFGEAPSGETRCFSLSCDGRLVEYNLGESSLERGVLVAQQATVCSHTVPTAMSFTPPLTYFQRGVIDTQLIIADASHHVRVFNPDTAVTSGTYRGPACSDSVAQMAIFQSASSSSTFLAFRCKSRAAGIMQWPTDGHPDSISAVMAHPGELAGVAVSCDGRRLITASRDGHVAQWSIDGAALERRSAAAGTGAERWRHALQDGPTLEEVQRYFLLSQIRAQGDAVAGPRKISPTVPLDHIPELMCAMGYYPTQSEITDIISNLASAAALRKEPKPTTVDLEKLLYLYYNFSPVAGVDLEEVQQAFKTLGASQPGMVLPTDRFVEAMTTLGEVMDADELTEAFRLLTGKPTVGEALPAKLTPGSFAELLGFESTAV
eukprot:jgi/Ulvmu1/4485/UM002_0210.1